MLAAQAQDLHIAPKRVADDCRSHVILDGKLFDCRRPAESPVSVKQETIDAWYSGKHRDSGAGVRAVTRPDSIPVETSPAMPEMGVTATLNRAAADLHPGAGQTPATKRRSGHQDTDQSSLPTANR
ncbi:hypothetical protein [Actinoplanes sp. NPDC049681]|uniref:hypothetical protein n=1 Tax=Actinoplanes sp. NPDC049681 TaxID=3363905 RepID=UPI00378EF410